MLVELLHNLLHAAHSQHLLDAVGIHVAVFHALQDHQDDLHTLTGIVELTDSIRRNTQYLCNVKGIVSDSGHHTREGRGRHFHSHTQGIDGGTEGGYLVNADTTLSTHGTYSLHKVSDGRSRSGTRGTQTVNR